MLDAIKPLSYLALFLILDLRGQVGQFRLHGLGSSSRASTLEILIIHVMSVGMIFTCFVRMTYKSGECVRVDLIKVINKK